MDCSNNFCFLYLPFVCLLRVFDYTESIYLFLSYIIDASDTYNEAKDLISQLVKTRNFIDRAWMFNCGLLANLAFKDELYTYSGKVYIKIEDSEDKDITKYFFSSLYFSYIDLYISDGIKCGVLDKKKFDSFIKSVLGLDSYKNDFLVKNKNEQLIHNLDARFYSLFQKYGKDFMNGFKQKLNANKNLTYYAIIPSNIENKINNKFYKNNTFCYDDVETNEEYKNRKTDYFSEKFNQKKRHTNPKKNIIKNTKDKRQKTRQDKKQNKRQKQKTTNNMKLLLF
jgi:hypothetical protein